MSLSRRVSEAALLLLPPGVMIYAAFSSGGFFPGAPAYIAVVLAIALLARMVMAADPVAGLGGLASLASGALAAFALWTLISERWSHAPGQALLAFDRVLDYLLALLLFASFARSRGRLAWALRILWAGTLVICACALITRLLPHLWPTSTKIANNRLSFPVGYWNVLGLLAGFGLILGIHLTCDRQQRLAVRVLTAAGMPILATTLYFTFSRGSIAVTLAASLVYLLAGRPRHFLSGAISAAVGGTAALLPAYHAEALSSLHPTSSRGVHEGHHVVLMVILAIFVAGALRLVLGLALDPRLSRMQLAAGRRRVARRALLGAGALLVLVSVIAFSGTIGHELHRFAQPPAAGDTRDLRSRLTDPSNNGRIELWKAAWRQFKISPLHGAGAGTFKDTWAMNRPNVLFVLNAHSLYLETLDELGVVGAVLLFGALLLVLVRTAWSVRGPDRTIHAATLAVILAWALQSAVDWDWQMPVVSLVPFVLGGLVLARQAPEPVVGGPPPAVRFPALASSARTLRAVAILVIGVAPLYVYLSQRPLDKASKAFAAGDYRAASRDTLSSISLLGIRPEAYELLAYCDLHEDLPNAALAAISRAVALDPHDWNYAFDLALMRAASGRDPLEAASRALSLNPRDPIVQLMYKTLNGDSSFEWQRDGAALADSLRSL